MSKLFLALSISAAVLTVANNPTAKLPVSPVAGQTLIADGPLPPPDPPDPPTNRSVEV
jgi:hypothetical protein